jgi:hypothetical protein
MIPAALPPDWEKAIRIGNAEVDILRVSLKDSVLPIQYLLPLPARMRPPTGRFHLPVPSGSVLRAANLIKKPEGGQTLGYLGLTWDVPRLRVRGSDLHYVVLFAASTAEDALPSPPPGFVREVVGAFYWGGSFRVYFETVAHAAARRG